MATGWCALHYMVCLASLACNNDVAQAGYGVFLPHQTRREDSEYMLWPDKLRQIQTHVGLCAQRSFSLIRGGLLWPVSSMHGMCVVLVGELRTECDAIHHRIGIAFRGIS
jgi:hypothetical protein